MSGLIKPRENQVQTSTLLGSVAISKKKGGRGSLARTVFVPGASFKERKQNLNYGQRFAASSQPAARAGGLTAAVTAGDGMRMGCCGAAAVRVGLGDSDMDIDIDVASFASSESKGAAMRRASTSFSKRVSSNSFCRNTSYTFFILGTCGVATTN